MACFTGSVVYNLYLHPLRRIPGPKLYAVSRIPWISDWLSGILHASVQRIHEEYGSVVRIAPDEVSFINSWAWNDIYGPKGAKFVERDRKWYANLTEGQDDIIVAKEADHLRFRKIFGPAFNDRALRENEGVVMRTIDLLMLRLKGHAKENNGTADMTKWYNWATFDIIGSLVYGKSFGCLEKSDYHPWLKVVLQNIRLSSYGALLERYSLFKRLLMLFLPRSVLEMRNMHLGVIRDLLAGRTKGQTSGKDVISLVEESDIHITQGELEANLGLLTMAGSETSATTLCAISFYLCKNQDASQKVRQEIDTVIHREEEICYEMTRNLPYLNAVIKEALRLYPPTPVGLPRRVVSKDGTFVGDFFVPKDVSTTFSRSQCPGTCYPMTLTVPAPFFIDGCVHPAIQRISIPTEFPRSGQILSRTVVGGSILCL